MKRYALEPLFGRVLSPFENFLARTTSGGIVLISTTVLTLILATWLGSDAMHHVWEQTFGFSVGTTFQLKLSWHMWINDALMALFFLLVGLELKREMLVGELASLKDAGLPVIAAVGGMVMPALIYLAFNAGSVGASGWGIPMATDIAFAVGILVLLSWRIPKNLIIFLTALAIADDLGAVLVIALFYTESLNTAALMAAGGLLAILCLFNRGGIRHPLPYAIVGGVMWYAVFLSGIHATVAGVLLAMTIPARAAFTPEQFDQRIKQLLTSFSAERQSDHSDDPLSNHRMSTIAEGMERASTQVQSPLQRLEHSLSPWVTFLIIPLFALSNAGIDLSAIRWGDALSQPVTLGVLLGLVLGKFAGISLFSWFAIKLGLGHLPQGVSWKQLTGAACLGGIGFTMSLFISQLAFKDPLLMEQAKLGILLASLIAALLGLGWLYLTARPKSVGA